MIIPPLFLLPYIVNPGPKTGPGRRSVLTPLPRGKYDGAALRHIRRTRGVGGPVKVFAQATAA